MPSFTLADLADSNPEAWNHFERYVLNVLERLPTAPDEMRMSLVPIRAYDRLYALSISSGKGDRESHVIACLAVSIVTELGLNARGGTV